MFPISRQSEKTPKAQIRCDLWKALIWGLSSCFIAVSASAQLGPVSENPIVTDAYGKMEAGQFDEALAAFKKALTENSEDLPALLGTAMIYADRAEHDKAFQTYDTIVKHYPNNAFAWNGRGLAAFNLEDFDEALSSFQAATVDRPVNGFFYESLAWTRMCRGEFNEAADSAKTATLMYNRKGESTIYPLLIAYFSYLEADKFREAAATLQYATQNKPANQWPSPVVDYLAGHIDQSDLISYVMDTAQETEAHTYIGLRLRMEGKIDAAEKHLNWVSLHGDERVFEYTLARALNLRSGIAAIVR